MKVVDYVLGRFTSEEIPDVNHSIEKAADACEEWLKTFPSNYEYFQ